MMNNNDVELAEGIWYRADILPHIMRLMAACNKHEIKCAVFVESSEEFPILVSQNNILEDEPVSEAMQSVLSAYEKKIQNEEAWKRLPVAAA